MLHYVYKGGLFYSRFEQGMLSVVPPLLVPCLVIHELNQRTLVRPVTRSCMFVKCHAFVQQTVVVHHESTWVQISFYAQVHGIRKRAKADKLLARMTAWPKGCCANAIRRRTASVERKEYADGIRRCFTFASHTTQRHVLRKVSSTRLDVRSV